MLQGMHTGEAWQPSGLKVAQRERADPEA